MHDRWLSPRAVGGTTRRRASEHDQRAWPVEAWSKVLQSELECEQQTGQQEGEQHEDEQHDDCAGQHEGEQHEDEQHTVIALKIIDEAYSESAELQGLLRLFRSGWDGMGLGPLEGNDVSSYSRLLLRPNPAFQSQACPCLDAKHAAADMLQTKRVRPARR